MKTVQSIWPLIFTSALVLGGTAHSQTAPDLQGVWSSTLTVRQDELWEIADYGCFIGCPAASYEYLRSLLNDPANDSRSFEELMVEAWNYGGERLVEIMTPRGRKLREELGLIDVDKQRCEPFGFVPQVLNPLPVEITQLADRVILRYEVWNVVRTIYVDGREHPENLPLARHGHSIGHYEGSTLVVETTSITPGRLNVEFGGGGHSEQLTTTERYWRSDNGNLLHLELMLEDPQIFREPLIYQKVWRHTPDVTLLEYSCETVTGQE